MSQESPKYPISLGALLGAVTGLFIWKSQLYPGLERPGNIISAVVGLLFVTYIGFQVFKRK